LRTHTTMSTHCARAYALAALQPFCPSVCPLSSSCALRIGSTLSSEWSPACQWCTRCTSARTPRRMRFRVSAIADAWFHAARGPCQARAAARIPPDPTVEAAVDRPAAASASRSRRATVRTAAALEDSTLPRPSPRDGGDAKQPITPTYCVKSPQTNTSRNKPANPHRVVVGRPAAFVARGLWFMDHARGD